MAIKLCTPNLHLLPAAVEKPRYDRASLGQGIVHIGVGGFHRAHQAVYTEDLFHLRRGPEHAGQWGICGVGLLPHDVAMRDALLPQDCLYTLVERSQEGDKARVVGSVTDFLFAPRNREGVLQKMAAEETKIVSMTITEGGYYVHGGSHELDVGHADIVHDLAHPHEPRSWPGFVLEALERRRRSGLSPFTLMSCDNIQGNGDVSKKVLLALAEGRNPGLASWIAQHGAFPNSMVDRITPATTDEHRALVRERFNIEDAWPVVCESFRQWVIEDRFVSGRPAWQEVGAQMTDDVAPYEKMKLRLLNASHQALCYIGLLLGYELVHQAMEDTDIRALVERLMDREVTPLLPQVLGVDLQIYKATLVERFSNPAVRDQLSRLGRHGSAGMPKFVLPSIEEQLRRGGPTRLLCFTVAAWLRYLDGRDEQGRELPMEDPMAPRLRSLAQASGQDAAPLLAVREIFSAELAASPEFTRQVSDFLRLFYERGARVALADALGR